MKHRFLIVHTIVFIILFIAAKISFAQLPTIPEPPKPIVQVEEKDNTSTTQAHIDVLANKITELENSLNEANLQTIGISEATARKRLSLTKDLKSLYERRLTADQRMKTLESSFLALQTEINSFKNSGFTEESPHSVTFLDSLNDQLDAEKDKLKTQQLTLQNTQKEFLQAQEAQQAADRIQKEKEDKFKNISPSDKTPAAEWDLEIARLESAIAAQTTALKKFQLSIAKEEERLLNERVQFLLLKISVLEKKVRFTSVQNNEIQIRWEQRQDATEQQLEKAKLNLDTYQVRIKDAQEKLDNARGEEQIQYQREIVDMLNEWGDALVDEVEALQEQLQNYATEKELWQIRFKLFNNLDESLIGKWEAQTGIILESVARSLAIVESRISTNRSIIIEQEKKRDELIKQDPSSQLKPIYDKRILALQHHANVLNDHLAHLNDIHRLAKTVKKQIAEKRSQFSIKYISMLVYEWVDKIWNFEIVSLDDQSITIKKVFFALIVFIIGLFLAKRLTKSIKQQASARAHVDESASAALEKILYYIFFVIIALTTLHMLNIPLTLFTFLGGAIAIAIGFGAQNLLNNFLSGLIILLERPIKINDIIEIENNYGIVRDIGARCTLIRLTSGIDVLVPNSAILEKNVINWTHSDLNIRFSISVGVAYGSDTRLVEKMIKQAIEEDKRVLTFPAPIILFSEFGDNALIFEVYFWIQVHRLMDSRIVRSDLRFRIDELFREHKITIAYPQRDIHLDTVKPLEIRIVPPEDKQI
ncbi:MAG: hypothetical protein C4541_07845 [Candidatus Auribacter fodinae]|uniref:Mechanosensitive ion channel protein MscS n=1 Tax=Candidatus Auribacter fodinae TaxID=2093366 RepID=A0A3A4R8D2_9BACT|nr:MAG: hypothetical protein C4541_07845 [Candidatus Auribacter fodinae]